LGIATEEIRDMNLKPFSEIAIGETFANNGNLWTKRSSRTAAGIWPACLPAIGYFRNAEICRPPFIPCAGYAGGEA